MRDQAGWRRWRRPLWRALKLAATVACILFVLRKIDLATAGAGIRDMGRRFGVAAAIFVTSQVISLVFRWRQALRELGVRVPAGAVASDFLAGIAYGSILPGTVGGDVVRAVRMGQRVSQPGVAVASIALDRMIGFICLSSVPVVGLALNGRDVSDSMLPIAVGALATFSVCLVFAHHAVHFVARLTTRALPAVARIAEETAGSLRSVTAFGRLRIAMWAFVCLAFAFGELLYLASSWHDPATPRAILIGAPIVFILSALPVTIGSIGFRESLFVVVLGRFGLGAEKALMLAAIWGLQWLFFALVAAVFVLVSGAVAGGAKVVKPSADSASRP
ncbi:MAG: flippase-like domain-containing protein [Thermoanaerobaculia bacterium]|nr:flippase-like domain-containing protein [Thermoanaerobaculia bacterium]